MQSLEQDRRGDFFKQVFLDGSVEHAKVISGASLGRLVIWVEAWAGACHKCGFRGV